MSLSDPQLNNSSFDGGLVFLRMESPLLVMMDPQLLDNLRDDLIGLDGQSLIDIDRKVMAFILSQEEGYARPGYLKITNFSPGPYRVVISQLVSIEIEGAIPGSFVVDTGGLILLDSSHISQVAKHLDWETYDGICGDDVTVESVVDAVGGPFFAIAHGFGGDGHYVLPSTAVQKVAQ